MSEYPQFCAVARAAEVFGERWTLLILRELWLGPKRFSDLKERLDPIAPGVLNGRLRSLQAHGVIRKRDVLPPTPATLYELTESGEAVGPALIELLRWGARYLFPPRPGERFEPDWFRMVLAAYAAPPPAPEAELGLAVSGDPAVRPAALVRAGPDGVVIFPYDGAFAPLRCSSKIVGVASRASARFSIMLYAPESKQPWPCR